LEQFERTNSAHFITVYSWGPFHKC